MAITLLDHQLIIDRVEAEVSKLKSVAGTAGLAAAAESLKKAPAAFVLPVSDRASANSIGTMVTRQNNTTRFGVIVAVQNLRDPRGEKAQADLLVLRQEILTTLHGWQPAAEFGPIEYGGGRVLQLTDQVLWWQDEFLTSHQMRSV